MSHDLPPGMVRRKDHATSIAAAHVVLKCRTKLHGRVLVALNTYGPMTDEELRTCPEFAIDGYDESTIRKRRGELVEAGYIYACGEKPNKRGNRMIIWFVTEKEWVADDDDDRE